MKIQNIPLYSAIVVGLLTALPACTNLERGRDVANPSIPAQVLAQQVCSNCHGLTGESTSPAFPKLAGQQKDYLLAQLTDFKGHVRSDSRGTQFMWGFTHLSEEQVEGLATYFSSQKAMSGRQQPGVNLERGAALFHNCIPESGVIACNNCHGANAEGNGTFPRLAGQHANYMIEQINVFKSTDQRPRGAVMKMVTHALSDDDVLAVAQYLASLNPAQ